MWPKLRSSVISSGSGHPGMAGGGALSELLLAKHASRSRQSAIDVNDEYRKALRSTSYINVWNKIRRHLPRSSTTTPRSRRPPTPSPTQEQQDDVSIATCATPITTTPKSSLPLSSSSPFFSYSHLPDYLLEPHNEVAALLAAVRDPDLHALFLDYFDATLQACNICASLLWSIDELRREHRTIRRMLGATVAGVDCAALASYVELENPFSTLTISQFRGVHDVYESLIRRLVLARDRILRRARLGRLVKRASAIMVVAVCGALATAVLVVGAHAVAILAAAGGPALVGPFSEWARRRRAGARRLARLGAQLDAAARGAYIMTRDMETMSRMVARLHEEVEHGKGVVRLFLRSGEGWVLRELAEWGGDGRGGGFSEQLDELEEHVYWCLLTINRIRGLVAREIAADTSSNSAPATTSSGWPMHA